MGEAMALDMSMETANECLSSMYISTITVLVSYLTILEAVYHLPTRMSG